MLSEQLQVKIFVYVDSLLTTSFKNIAIKVPIPEHIQTTTIVTIESSETTDLIKK
jgi:N-glycosylase/DNA lyase